MRSHWNSPAGGGGLSLLRSPGISQGICSTGEPFVRARHSGKHRSRQPRLSHHGMYVRQTLFAAASIHPSRSFPPEEASGQIPPPSYSPQAPKRIARPALATAATARDMNRSPSSPCASARNIWGLLQLNDRRKGPLFPGVNRALGETRRLSRGRHCEISSGRGFVRKVKIDCADSTIPAFWELSTGTWMASSRMPTTNF